MIFKLVLISCLALHAQGQTTTGESCNKNVDCIPNASCLMYDHASLQYPNMWPPCPHVGYCQCNNGYVLYSSNTTCMPYRDLNLNDACGPNVWERIRNEHKCEGGKVVCNTPTYEVQGAGCRLVPQPTAAPVPAVVVPTATPCQSVGYLQYCETGKSCCTGFGLTCQQKGSNSTYSQCRCEKKTDIFDGGACRPRRYGDYCTADDECGSGLISNTGYVCRLGRCRCSTGFEPHDNQFWNETSRTTYTWRICISSTAINWVPTGRLCTMEPHLWADKNDTRVCHPRAFCHLCHGARGSYTAGSTTTRTWGVCRERTCSGNGECGNNGQCNNWGMQIDPPCERGMCDCNWNNGFYKDRFSRCSSYQNLNLGDRCIVPDAMTQLHEWYPNNEDWADNRACVADVSNWDWTNSGSGSSGSSSSSSVSGINIAGYNWGHVKCRLPLIEDADGNCVANDDQQYQLFQWIGFNQTCDYTDDRLNLKRCDASRGLTCQDNRCQCTAQTCSASYVGCTSSGSTGSVTFWDGNKCRARGQLGERCDSNADCCGGYCINNQCGCSADTRLVTFSNASSINNGGNRISVERSTVSYCFRNVSVVGKGQECDLDPIGRSCGNYQYGEQNVVKRVVVPQVCQSGLICMRCPIDYSPDDEARGICRQVSQIADTRPAPTRPCNNVNPGGNNNGNWGNVGNWGQWGNMGQWGRWNSASSLVSQTAVIALVILCAALL